MSEETAFLRAIQANPSDSTAKLVYADWLDEHGEHEKAEYLRIVTSPRAESEPTRMRRYELERRLRVWLELVRGLAPLWDTVTMFALGRLRGLLDGYAALSGHESDIGYEFDVHLR